MCYNNSNKIPCISCLIRKILNLKFKGFALTWSNLIKNYVIILLVLSYLLTEVIWTYHH